MITRVKLIFLFSISFLFACNNPSTPAEKNNVENQPATLPADSMTREALFSFIDGCVANAKLTLGEQKAFGFCKCIYDQLRAKNPSVDSAQLDALVNDTARVAKMAANCR